jgi:hypothetical protein
MTSTMQKTSSNDTTNIRELRNVFERHESGGITRADLEQRESIAVDQLATEDQPAGEVHE